MKDILREKTESQLNKLETMVANGIELSDKDINDAKTILNKILYLKKEADLTKEEIADIENRFEKATNKSLKEKKFNISYISKSLKTKIAAVALVGTMGVSAIACTASKEEEPVEAVTMMTTSVAEEVKATSMDEEYVTIQEGMLNGFNNELETGLTDDHLIDETNLEQYAKSYALYYISQTFDNYTDEQIANMFPNSTISGKDLMDAKYAWEWIDEQRVTVSDNYLDYNIAYNDADAKLLEDAAELLNKYKAADSKTKKTIGQEFVEYTRKNVMSDDANILYTPLAMDTFRAVYFDAFDEVSNRKVITDELEHALNTVISCSVNESNLNVEDKTVKGLQSEFQTYMSQKYDSRLQVAWNYVALNKEDINEYNNFENMVEYITQNADLSKEVQLGNYDDELAKITFSNTKGAIKHQHDSNIKDPKGIGNITNDVENGGIKPGETIQQYEMRRDQETKQIEYVLDPKGQVETMSKAQREAEAQAGYYRGLANQPKEAGRSEYYYINYDKGLADYQESLKKFPSNPTTTYENVTTEENVISNESETITNNYTSDPIIENNQIVVPNDVPGTSFESIDGEEINTESEITEFDYTGAINDLKALRNSLSASIDNNYSNGRSI